MRAACNCPTCTETRREQEVPTKIWLVSVVKPESFPAKVGEGTANIFTQHYIAITPHTPQNNTRIYQTPADRCEGSNFTSTESHAFVNWYQQKLRNWNKICLNEAQPDNAKLWFLFKNSRRISCQNMASTASINHRQFDTQNVPQWMQTVGWLLAIMASDESWTWTCFIACYVAINVVHYRRSRTGCFHIWLSNGNMTFSTAAAEVHKQWQ